MKMTCPKCGCTLDYKIPNDVKNSIGECPKCHELVCLSGFRKAYKIVTIRDLCGRKNLNDDGVRDHAEMALNNLARAGWRVVGLSTQHVPDFSLGGNHDEPFFVLERDVPC